MSDTLAERLAVDEQSSSPLANWGNDDLLLTEHARGLIADAAPRASRVLDWPLLRREFEQRDAEANRNKRTFNRQGVMGAFVSAMGASILASAPLFPHGEPERTVLILGCGFILIGGLMGLWHLIGHSGRAKWLQGRLWTERLRQFYFQYLINNLDTAVSAMDDDAALERYRASRDGALKSFIDSTAAQLSARGFVDAISWLAHDHDDIRAWGQNSWQQQKELQVAKANADHWELFECLSKQRIGIQEIYARLNLKKGSASQGNKARHVLVYGNIATFVFVVSLALAGLWTLLHKEGDRLPADLLIAVSGVAAAWGLYFRLADQGMGYSQDAERYELYAEQVDHVRQRFDAAREDIVGKISALRLLEVYSYRELRQFLATHVRSRFLG
jgi:fatty acid desaturase